MLQWLQVFGRFHVLVLHLPFGLLIGLAAVEFFGVLRRRPAPREVTGALAWLAAGACVLAAAMGYVLSFESGYGGDTLTTHLYLGLALAGVCVVTALLHGRERRLAFRSSLLLSLALLVPTGHFGGTMTHGEDFVLHPLRAEPTTIAAPGSAELSTTVFAARIAPMLAARCTACHGESRTKGDLALHTREAIAAGGKHGVVINTANPEASELLRRVKLPLDHKEHMPPRDKPQPAPEEVAALESWIHAGASFEAPMTAASLEAHAASDHAHEHGAGAATTSRTPTPVAAPPLPAPPVEAVAALRTRLAHVEPVERGSNLLWVDFAAAATTITDADVESLLTPLQGHIAELSLARSAITDRSLIVVAGMPHLRRLDLRSAAITDAGISALRSHPRVEELVLAQTRLSDNAIEHLAAMPALARINIWRSGISADAALTLSARRQSLVIETGERPVGTPVQTEDAITLTGDAPVAPPATPSAASTPLKPQNTLCPVSGKAVDPDYVIIYRGRIIGFCCRHCAEQFWIDPAKYENALGQ